MMHRNKPMDVREYMSAYCKICQKTTQYRRINFLCPVERGDEPLTTCYSTKTNACVSVWKCNECEENHVTMVE